MKREIELEVAGQRLRVRTDEDEAYMQSLAMFVAERMRVVSQGQRGTTTLNVAILSAVLIADELHRARDGHDGLDDRLEAMASKLEGVLADGDSN